MKIVTIVGARPQFVKAAALSREVRKHHHEILIHTGQHYDYRMSGIFFEGLDMPAPDVNLEVGSGSHGAQTASMLAGIEQVLISERPDCMIVYGDTNSTLAGALAAAKLSIPIAHVEAGLRSFNRAMPEELNRVIADHLAALLLCPSRTAADNLAAEGIRHNVHIVGDVMQDVLRWVRERVACQPPIANRWDLGGHSYLLATVHRGENTDNATRLAGIIAAFNRIQEPVVFPVHPRTQKVIAASGIAVGRHVKLIEPLGYVEMIAAASGARLILTDSGGLQKEAYWLGVPCVTLRDETEWVETVQLGWNTLVGAHTDRIVDAVRTVVGPPERPPLYGDGAASMHCESLIRDLVAAIVPAKVAATC